MIPPAAKFAATAIGFTLFGVLGHVGYEWAIPNYDPVKGAESQARIRACELKAYEDKLRLDIMQHLEFAADYKARGQPDRAEACRREASELAKALR